LCPSAGTRTNSLLHTWMGARALRSPKPMLASQT
jgi:hypothetical protein